MRHSIKRAILVASVSAFALTGVAIAQEANESEDEAARLFAPDVITVTSRFREETVQDIGASIGVMSGDEMSERLITDFEDLSSLIAGVQVIKYQPSTNDISVRGVQNGLWGNGDGFTSSPVVSLFVDEVAVSGPASSQRDFNYFDFNRTEVLRGPQPTLFGEGAVGGAVRYFSADPDLDGPQVTGTAGGAWETITDGSSSYRVENATSLILSPGKLGVRLVGTYRNDGGFIDNPTIAQEDVNTYEATGGRAVILARPTANLELRLSAFVSRDEIGERTQVDPLSDPDDLTFASAPVLGNSSDDFELFAGRITYDFENFELTSITGLYTRDMETTAFSAGNTFGLMPFLPGFDTTSFQVSARDQETFSQELRLVSDLGGAFNFTAGLFYNQTESSADSLIRAPGLATAITPSSEVLAIQTTALDIEEISGFFEGTFELSDRLRLIAGVRYVHEDLDNTLVQQKVPNLLPIVPIPPSSLPLPVVDAVGLLALQGLDNTFTFELRRWLPRVGVEYDISDNVLFYANAAQGVRNGNLNSATSVLGITMDPTTGLVDFDAFLDLLQIDEDEVTSIDAGLKSVLDDGRWILNVGGFYSTYDNTQVTVALPANAVLNGPDQVLYGLEVETSYTWSDELTTFANLSLLETEFQEDYSSTASPIIDISEGNQAGNQPNLSFAVGYAYERGLSRGDWALYSQGSFSYVGERYAQPQNVPSTELESLSLLNLNLGLKNDRLRIGIYGQNLLNDVERVSSTAAVLGASVGADNRITDLNRQFASVNTPRSIGIQLSVEY
jgi:outer membrane receptor protein involved in Fe transport